MNHPDIYWRDNTAGHKQSSWFLEGMEDSFLTQVIKELMRGDTLLDLILTNKEELVGDVKVRDSLGNSDHGIVELRIPLGENKANSRPQPCSSGEEILACPCLLPILGL